MPYRLHPSGYCVAFGETSNENLVPGKSCIFCGRVAGHAHDCPESQTFPMAGQVDNFLSGKSSRGSLFNAVSVLWHRSRVKSFITFTLPSISGGVYQRSPFCEATGDIAVTAKFSKVLEAYALRVKRAWGEKLSYVWVSEAQMKRQEKFGGIGDIHFHLVVNQKIKEDNGRVCDLEALQWLQSLWCKHVGVDSNNCLHVDPIPDNVNSIPSYLSKYLGKGSMRKIISRRFGASRDLTEIKPITLTCRPDAGLIRQCIKDVGDFKVITEYYQTGEVLERYGKFMQLESQFVGGAKGRARDLNAEQAAIRAERKTEREYWDKVAGFLQSDHESVDAVIRPTHRNKPLTYRTKKELKLLAELERIRNCTKGSS